MSGLLVGKVALITGGGSGIGRAAALIFAREGAKVAVADVDEGTAEQTAVKIVGTGGEARPYAVDVRVDAQVGTLVERVVADFGRLDCAFNNAGIGGGGVASHEYPEEQFDQVIAVNLKGVWLCMKHEIPVMLRQGGGAIVNTASIAGLVAIGGIAYIASKHAVIGMTKKAAVEYADRGIRVNAVCPGNTDTPMMDRAFQRRPEREAEIRATSPMHRLATPDEIAEAAAWLCSDAASFVTGQALAVDGGWVAQ
jgi:NAD(P)-dependent dehydrogenase (short-subunit alcohol dehydrogenase family)